MSDRRQHRAAAQTYRFLDFELDLRAGELLRDGQKLALSRQQLALLGTLVRAQGRTVERATLLREVWAGVAVSEGALRQAVWEMRKLLGGAGDHVIEAVRGRGYRLIPKVDAGSLAASADQPVDAGRTGLLGRALELRELEGMRDDALQRAGRACLILGPPGVGKSRLAREVVERAGLDGIACSESHADRDGALPPLWPWTQLLESCLREVDDALRARCRAVAPDVFAWLEADALSARAQALQEPSQRRLGFFEQLSRALSILLKHEPRVCLLEDLQWVDEASLAFLAHYARALTQSRALLVLTCRPLEDGASPALARALDALAQGPHNQRLPLSNLGPDEVAALLTPQLGDAATRPLVEQVHALTGGNPLFVLELSRALGEHAARGEPVDLQQDTSALQPVLERRLRNLPGALLRTLQAAAVLSRDFAPVELAALLECSLRDALSSIDECLQRGILMEVGEHRFAFAHPLLQHGTYALLAYRERCRMHELAALWLESLESEASPRRMSELAHHFFRAAAAGQERKAIDYGRRAAEAALAATAYGDAAAHFQRALQCAELLADCTATERLALELSQLEALHAQNGSNDETRAAYFALAERARAASSWTLFARAALGYTGHQHRRFVAARHAAEVDPREVQLLEQALAGLGPARSELRVLTLCSLAYALLGTGDVARRRELLGEAFEHAQQLGEPALLARVMGFRIIGETGPGRLGESLEICDALVELTLEHGLHELELDARVARYLMQFVLGDRGSAMRDAERAAQLGELVGTARAKSRAQLPAFIDAFGTGQLREAQRLADETRDAAPDDPNQQVIWMARLASLQVLRGELHPSMLAVGYEFMLAANPHAVNLRAVLSSTYATLGRHDDARREFDAVAGDHCAALPDDVHWLSTMALLADTVVHLQDAERARPLYDLLLPHADMFLFFGVETAPGSAVSLWLGELAVLLGDLERAQHWIERAHAMHEALGMTMLHQYTALTRVRLLIAVGSSAALRSARTLLSEVRRFGTDHGVTWLVQCAADLERTIDRSPAAACEARRADQN